MKALKILEEKKKNKEIKYIELSKILGITKQCFYWHLKNLKHGKVSFSVVQIQKICTCLGQDTSIFLIDISTKKYKYLIKKGGLTINNQNEKGGVGCQI